MKFKERVNSTFEFIEYAAYTIVGFLLIVTALFLTFDIVKSFFNLPPPDKMILWVVEVLDRVLLMLMMTEILYTVRLSIKKHTLYSEPFLIVGLIAAIRRILVISVETAYQPEKFEPFMIEMSILGVLIFIFVVSIIFLRKHASPKTSEE